ncbi:MAG: single-stranded DNA-binding protein [Lachnospiraceae bacterium]|nr:single-stranded DNA-binding protein [Lachnospiraceae bacterium]
MNKVILMGRLTRDPEIRYAQDNSLPVARFTIAVDRRFKRDNSQQTADFISCVAFGKTAEFFEKYMKQGTKVCLEGRIQTNSYTKQDGSKAYSTDVVVENVEFAESKNASSNSGYQAAPQQPQAAPAPAPAPSPMEAAGEGFMNIADGLEDEGLPFN